MNKFTDKPVVVPWDFSESSKTALQRAIELAGSNEQIEVVHVTSYPAAMEPGVVWGTYSEELIQRNLLKSFRATVLESRYPGISFTAYFGDPGSEIVRHADNVDAGLIVVSSHGRTGLSRFLIGSVAERVVRLAHCPVLVLREPKEK